MRLTELKSVALSHLSSSWTWLVGWLYTRQTLYAGSCALLLGVGTFFWWMTGKRQEAAGPLQPPPPAKAAPLPLPKSQVSSLGSREKAKSATGDGAAGGAVRSGAAESGGALEEQVDQKRDSSFTMKRRLVPFDAAKIALLDALQYDPVKDTPFLRYLFIPDTPDVWVPTLNFAVNMCVSQSLFIQYGTQIHPNVLRYDLRLLATDPDDLKNLINVWEQFAFDPYFHEFVTLKDKTDNALEQAQDALKIFLEAGGAKLQAFADALAKLGDDSAKAEWTQFLKLAQLKTEMSKTRVFDLVFLNQFVKDADQAIKTLSDDATSKSDKGKALVQTLKDLRDAVEQLAKEAGKTQVVEVVGRRSAQGGLGSNVEVPIPARHGGAALAVLVQLTQSDAAITFAPHYLHRTCATVDLGHGAGLYYDFVGIKSNQNDGLTDFQRFLKDFGINLEQIDVLESLNAAAIFTSNVTGRERKVIFLQGSGARPAVAGALLTYTQDPGENQTAAANSPMRNLINFEFAAQEAIADRKNGMLAWALFDAAGVLQLSAPDFVVSDHSVPAPYCTRLHAPISCIRCHGPQRGHMPVKNDVELLTSKRIDILDDQASADKLDELLQILVAIYRWRPDDETSRAPLVRSRDDFAYAIYLATAGIGRPGYQVYQYPRGWSAAEACGKMGELWNGYSYQWITPLIALRELGYEVESEKEALKLIQHVIPAIGPDPVFGITLLDPTIAAIRLGIPVPRASYELVYFDLALRSLLTAQEVAAGEVQPELLNSKSGKTPLTRNFKPRKDLREQIKDFKARMQAQGITPGSVPNAPQRSSPPKDKVKSQVAP